MQDGSSSGTPEQPQPSPQQPPVAPPQPPTGPPPSQFTTAPAPPPPPGSPAPPPPGSPAPPPPAAQPPAAQAPVAETPAAPQAPAPRKRTGLWIGISVGILALLMLCGCAAIFIGGFFSSAAKTREAFADAEVHYLRAVTIVTDADKALEALEDSDDPELAADQWAAELDPAVAAARKELDAAATEISDVDDSEAKTAYLASVDSAQKVLDQKETMSEEFQQLGDIANDVAGIGKTAGSANKSLESAVDAADDAKWNAAISRAQRALSGYRSTEAKSRALDRKYPNLGFEAFVSELSTKRRAATQLIAAAKAGKAGNRSSYSKAIHAYNKLAAKTGKAEFDPEKLLDDFWSAYTESNEQWFAAVAAHDAAAKAIESGKY